MHERRGPFRGRPAFKHRFGGPILRNTMAPSNQRHPAARGRAAWRIVMSALAAVHPVWWLNVAVCACAATLAARVVAMYPAIAEPHLSWWLLAIAVGICERWPVNLQFQRSSHSFSMTDIPVALGFLFASGADAIGGLVLGTAVAMLLRRLPLIKFVFNLGQFVLAVALGTMIVHAVAGPVPEFGPRVWFGTLLGTQAGGLVTILLLAAAMSLADGRVSRAEVRQMFGMDLVVTVASTSLALVAAMLVAKTPAGLPFLALPVMIAFGGYRAYVREHERHKKVEFLYQANRSLSESPEVAVAVEGLLGRAREAFRAEQAEVILFGSDGTAPLRTRLGAAGESVSLEPVDPQAAAVLRELASGGAVALSTPVPQVVQELSAGAELRNAMIAVLRSDERIIGTIMLANRVGLGRGFGEDDLALFETLATNASAALQFDRLEQAVMELRDLQDRLHHQAYHDPLTGLANRALLAQQVSGALDQGVAVAVMFIDLDDFKGVNDALGHGVGDQLLCAAGARITRSVRADDLVARLGGDEFAVLLKSSPTTVDANATETAECVVRAFELPVTVAQRMLSVHLSVGVATSLHSGPSTADLLRDADVAMYEAKSAGKRRYALFTPGMRDAVVRRHTLRDELESAIEKRQLLVQYQPIVELRGGVTALEALVRWEHPTRGRIPPNEFVPLAEESGLIIALGRYVLREACEQAMTWSRAGGTPTMMQVNLSARELEDADLIASVRDTLAATGLPPERLTLEITETLLVRDAVAGGATLNALRGLGIQLALDDFGTGYSSLSYLRSLPLNSLKIAKEFVDGMTRTDDDATFVRLIVELARLRGLRVVAEGIETAEQLTALRAIGCDQGQGYYFSRPLDPDDPNLADAIGWAPAIELDARPWARTGGFGPGLAGQALPA
jgi:diguanylate cyclase (GGDEF)-like protein